MSYLLLKNLHIGCVMLSGAGFLLRGLWMLADSPWLQRPGVRVLPHLVDTVLLTSAPDRRRHRCRRGQVPESCG
jgi:uncharacterized membrane protein SirB2